MKSMFRTLRGIYAAGLVILLATVVGADAKVDGITGTGDGSAANPRTFNLIAKEANIVTNDANTIYSWGYADATTGIMQYPGPVMIVNQGDVVRVSLSNTLPVPVSIVFPGQIGVTASGGSVGLLTNEVPPAPAAGPATGPVTYSFVAGMPGTYLYHSGSMPSLEKDMGLIGAIVVRPTAFDAATPANRRAYGHAGSQYDREFLILLSDMDAAIHDAVYTVVRSQRQAGHSLPYDLSSIDTSKFYASLWFINGRNSPDTLVDAGAWWLPNQPYSAAPIMHPGERVLIREVSAGRDGHPFHHHGAHMLPIARDARMLESAPGAGPDLTSPDFTIRSIPGQTMDLIFEWTGKNIGWDIYGTADNHSCTPDANGYDITTREWCADHGKPFPVVLPNQQDLQFGEYYSGTPFLGQYGTLPAGHPGLNEHGGYFHIWHSHNEKEITTNNVFPGGMKTFLIIEAPNVPIVE
jgi:FtsP/CotA-like multicopper oxidase with cupredoxin domain